MAMFRVKLVNEHFRKISSGNCPKHRLDFEAIDIKDAWHKAFPIVEDFNAKGGKEINGYYAKEGYDKDWNKKWADWKICGVVKI